MQNRPANGFYENARKYNVHDKSRTNAGSIVRPQLLPSHPSSLGWDYEARSGLKMSLTRAKRYLSRMLFPSYRQPRSPKIMSSFSSATIPSLDMTGNARFIALCAVWYMTSAMSSNTGKAIMQHFRFPITLTIVQFAFVAAYCILAMSPLVQFTKFRPPTKAILRNTLPMGMFQVGGHVFSSIAISRIPVSTLHTIKALSPLFTVAAYALLFGVSYSSKTYISLLPLTLGVMLACSFDMSASNAVGLLCAFGSALVFVSSNIFFKKIMPSGSSQTAGLKLDKVNLLFYSSSMAFLLMIPLWLYEDLPTLLAMRNEPAHVTHPAHGHETAHSVGYYFFMNGTVHFAQNLIAFIILSSTSPVTYSIASLIKRVAVICIAIVWFNQSVHPIQGLGITLTFVGLYMYNNAKSDVEKGEKKMRRVEAAKDMMLPSTISESLDTMEKVEFVPPMRSSGAETSTMGMGGQTLYGRHRGGPPVGPPPPSARMHAFPQPTHMYAAPRRQPPTTHHAHSRVTPNLSVKVTPEQLNPLQSPMFDQRIQSPMESYPSPPPSLDSPPRKNMSLGYAEHDHFSASPRHVSVRA